MLRVCVGVGGSLCFYVSSCKSRENRPPVRIILLRLKYVCSKDVVSHYSSYTRTLTFFYHIHVHMVRVLLYIQRVMFCVSLGLLLCTIPLLLYCCGSTATVAAQQSVNRAMSMCHVLWCTAVHRRECVQATDRVTIRDGVRGWVVGNFVLFSFRVAFLTPPPNQTCNNRGRRLLLAVCVCMNMTAKKKSLRTPQHDGALVSLSPFSLAVSDAVVGTRSPRRRVQKEQGKSPYMMALSSVSPTAVVSGPYTRSRISPVGFKRKDKDPRLPSAPADIPHLSVLL